VQKIIGYTLLVGLVALAGWGFIEAVQAEPAVAGTVGAALIPLGGALLQQRRAEQARVREANRDRMASTYDELLRIMVERFGAGGKPMTPKAEKEIEAFMRDLKGRHLALGASAEMICAFNRWQVVTREAGEAEDGARAVSAWEALVRCIRQEIGHDDSDLPPGELLRLLIVDFDEHFSVG
jgi:hypothetical protein